MVDELDGIPAATELVPYERGLPSAMGAKALLGRFLPGSLLGFGVVYGLMGIPGHGSLAESLLIGVLVILVPLAVGFGVGLEGLRRWLFPDAEIHGRRSFVAGLTSSLAVSMILSWVALTTPQAIATFFLVGLAVAVSMFFAWLYPTPQDDQELRAWIEREGAGSSGGASRAQL